jgi:hypothetical protein
MFDSMHGKFTLKFESIYFHKVSLVAVSHVSSLKSAG